MVQNQGSLITHSAVQTLWNRECVLVESGFCPGSKAGQLYLPASLQGAGLKDWQASRDTDRRPGQQANEGNPGPAVTWIPQCLSVVSTVDGPAMSRFRPAPERDTKSPLCVSFCPMKGPFKGVAFYWAQGHF